MIANYYGLNVRQEDFAFGHCGIDSNGRINNCTAEVDIINEYLNQCYKTHCIHAPRNDGRPDVNMLISLLSEKRPILLAYHGPSIGHAIALTGISYTETFWGKELQSMVIRDPSPTIYNQANAGRIEYDKNNANALLDAVYAWWAPVVTYYPVQPPRFRYQIPVIG